MLKVIFFSLLLVGCAAPGGGYQSGRYMPIYIPQNPVQQPAIPRFSSPAPTPPASYYIQPQMNCRQNAIGNVVYTNCY